jgi:excisionase family DNA binding protein
MTKKEAADFLSCSQKTIDRLVRRGELSATLQRGKTGDIVVFDEQELASYKEKRDQPKAYMPALVAEQPAAADGERSARSLMVMGQANMEPAANARFSMSVESLATSQRLIALQGKPTLTLGEAASYSGLSKKIIDQAVKSGELKTFQGQRGSKVIKKKDLDQFIDEL